jgi:hypothetical protein
MQYQVAGTSSRWDPVEAKKMVWKKVCATQGKKGKKVKLSLVLNYAEVWGSGGIAPRILNLGIRWR